MPRHKRKVTAGDLYARLYEEKPGIHQAVDELNGALDDFFNDAVTYDRNTALNDEGHKQTVHVIKAPAGLGKTEAVLNRLTGQDWMGKRVLYLVPTIQLADELHEKCRDKGLASRVIRGRSQPLSTADMEQNRRMGENHPHIQIYNEFTDEQKKTGKNDQDGKAIRWEPAIDRMCSKWELAESMATNNINVSTTLCERKTEITDENGNKVVERCPFFETCPYQIQKRNRDGGILIGAHQYLSFSMEMISYKNIDLLIIDESFWPSLVRKSVIRADRLLDVKRIKTRDISGRTLGQESNDEQETLFMKNIVRIFRETLDGNQSVPTIQDILDAGLDSQSFTEAKIYEYSLMQRADVGPNDSYSTQNNYVMSRIVSEALRYGRFWEIVSSEIDSGRTGYFNGLKFLDNNDDGNDVANRITMFYHSKVKYQHVPVLIIDADANQNILENFFNCGITKFTDIKVRWSNVFTYQNVNSAYSKFKLLGHASNEESIASAVNSRRRLHNFMETICWIHKERISADPSSKPVLITYMDVEKCLLQEFPNLRELYDIDHFQNIRGKDRWKNTSAIVIAGRPLPGADEVEGIARAIYYKSGVEIQAANGFQAQQKPISFTSNRAIDVECYRAEADRVNDVLEQIRDAELTQAIARCRPIHRTPDNQCEIYIFTDVPLDVPVDEPLFLKNGVMDNEMNHIRDGVIFTPVMRRTGTAPKRKARQEQLETCNDVTIHEGASMWYGYPTYHPRVHGLYVARPFIMVNVKTSKWVNERSIYIALDSGDNLDSIRQKVATKVALTKTSSVKFPNLQIPTRNILDLVE